MAKVDSNVEITLKKVRLSFEHIFKAQIPKPDKDGKVGPATFNCAFLVSKKDDKMLDEIEDAIEECKKKMWGDKPPKIRADRTPYRDGEDYEYDGYPGNMVISARNQRAPSVVHSKKDEDGKFVRLDGSEGVIYSGCYVNGIVRFWAQDSQDYGKRVNCSLEVVQFYSDGDAFSGASRVDADDRLAGLEGEVKDDDPRTEGRRRERDRDEEKDDGRRSRERDTPRRDRDEETPRRGRESERHEDRGGGRDRDGRDSGRGRDRDEERGSERSRSSRDDGDDKPSRDRRPSRDDDERESDRGSSRRSSERDEPRGRDDRDRGGDRERSSRSREDEDRPRSRSRDAEDDDRPSRSSRDEERPRSRDRDEGSSRRGRDRSSDLI